MADVVDGGHRVETCRWGTMTLWLPYPHWFSAEDCPWSCVWRSRPRLLESTAECQTCATWVPKLKTVERSGRRPV